MKALDTNVLVRLLTNDEPGMRDRAAEIIDTATNRSEPLLLPIPVLLELIWVLRARYTFSKKEILDSVEALLLVEGLQFEARNRVEECVCLGRSESTDLADILIGLCAKDLGCECTLTFDKKASKSKLFEGIRQ